ncbi:MAG: dihydrofolate reductase family protein [Anaeromyxobacter sp.]
MRKLIVHEFMTLDGVMQAPGGVDEDLDGGFPHGGWVMRNFHEDIGKTFGTLMQGVDAFLLGRRTYLGHAGAFEPLPAGDFFGDLMNAPKKYVVSRTIEKPTWRDTTIVRDDPVAFTRKLKAQPGGTILVDGSSPLVHALLQADLVDELHLTMFPVVVGQGKRVFPAGWSNTLKLESARPYPNGAVHLHYRSSR